METADTLGVHVRRTVFLLATLLLSACSPKLRLVRAWQSQDIPATPVKKFLVVGISDDPVAAATFENDMVNALTKENANAVSSANETGVPQKDADAIREQASRLGVDAVLTANVVSVKTESEWVPPQTVVGYDTPYYYGGGFPYPGYYGNFGPYYGQAVTVTTVDGYWKEKTNVVLECSLFQVPGGALLWTVNSEITNPRKRESVVKQLNNIVVRELRSRGFMAP